MKKFQLFFCLLLVFLAGCFSPPKVDERVYWSRTEVNLVIGKSTIQDVLTLLGEPSSIDSRIEEKEKFDFLIYTSSKVKKIFIITFTTPSNLTYTKTYDNSLTLRFTDKVLTKIY